MIPAPRRGREPGSCPEGSEGDGSAVSLHGLTSMTLGVPDVEAVASYYEDFGLRRVGDRRGRGLVLATADGGGQLAVPPGRAAPAARDRDRRRRSRRPEPDRGEPATAGGGVRAGCREPAGPGSEL